MPKCWTIILLFFFNQAMANPCVKSTAFCLKRYDELTFLTTHNSFNYAWRGKIKKTGPKAYLFPNQNLPIEDQLHDGVRAFMLDLHPYQGPLKKYKNQVILCHGGKACGLLGMELAQNVFKNFRTFLEENPQEILTFILESYVSTRDLKQSLEKAGLTSYLHCQSPHASWPLFKEMIEAPLSDDKHSPTCNKKGRLVILNDRREENDPAWNLDLFGHFAFETKYSYQKINDLDCDLNRGNPSHSLFIFNHFTTFISGKKRDAKKINRYHFLKKRIHNCQIKNQRKINFLTIDFFKNGETLKVVDELNHL